MKSKFAFGMFAGFALACLFFFFFLFFFPSVFRVQAAKKSPRFDVVGYAQGYGSYRAAEYGKKYVALDEYEGQESVVYQPPADYSYAIDDVLTTSSAAEQPAYAYKYKYEYGGTLAQAVAPAIAPDYPAAS